MAWQPPPDELWHSPWQPAIRDYLHRLIPAIPAGVRLTSWHRTPASNRAARGSPESQHLFALGTDWVGGQGALAELRRRARARGLVVVRESDHLHIQRFPRGALARAGVTFPRV